MVLVAVRGGDMQTHDIRREITWNSMIQLNVHVGFKYSKRSKGGGWILEQRVSIAFCNFHEVKSKAQLRPSQFWRLGT